MATEDTAPVGDDSADVGADVGGAEEGGAPQETAGAAPEAGAQSAGPNRIRARHWEKLNTELSNTRQEFTKATQEWRSELARRDAELAELRGYLKAQQEQREAQRSAEPTGPTAEQLLDEAQKALDANDMRTYHRKLLEANTAASLAQVKTLLPRQQPQQTAPQMDPVIQGMWFTTASQVGGDPKRVLDLAIVKDRELHLLGVPESHDRYRMAFDQAAKALGGGQKPAAPSYSQGLASTLNAPPSRPAAASSKQEATETPLTSEQRMVAEWMGGEAEYRKHMGK